MSNQFRTKRDYAERDVANWHHIAIGRERRWTAKTDRFRACEEYFAAAQRLNAIPGVRYDLDSRIVVYYGWARYYDAYPARAS